MFWKVLLSWLNGIYSGLVSLPILMGSCFYVSFLLVAISSDWMEARCVCVSVSVHLVEHIDMTHI